MRLHVELRGVRAAAEAVEGELAGDTGADSTDPEDILAVVDTMTASASERLNAATAAVVEEVNTLLAAAAQTAQAVLAEAGIDGSRVASIRPRPVTFPASTPTPRKAAVLWDEVTQARSAERNSAASAAGFDLDEALHRPDVAGWDAADVNEWFWKDVRSDHPVRDRLFKFTQREQS